MERKTMLATAQTSATEMATRRTIQDKRSASSGVPAATGRRRGRPAVDRSVGGRLDRGAGIEGERAGDVGEALHGLLHGVALRAPVEAHEGALVHGDLLDLAI